MTPEEAAADPDAFENGDHGLQPEDVWSFAPEADSAPSLIGHVPTDLSGLGWTRHFARRVLLDDRPPSLEQAREAYRDGEWRGWQDKGLTRLHRVDGVEFILIVGFSNRLVPYMVTAYPRVVDVEKALASDQFDSDAIARAAAVTLIKTQDPLGDDMKPVELRKDEELEIHGHTLISYRGATYLRCTDCGVMMQGQSDLVNHDCV